MLATAVVAAVTTPVILLSVTPALADVKSSVASGTQQRGTQDKPSIEELEKAAEKARKAYEAAEAAHQAARVVLEAALSDDAPLAVAAKAAKKEAAEAATAKENADKALADAKAALAALPETATAEEKAAAEKAVTDAETAAVSAAGAKTAADSKATAAGTARDDARVAAAREYDKVQNALKEALKEKEAADKALADAKDEAGEPDEPSCVPEGKLTTVVKGLPSKLVAGATTDFSVRVTNGTKKSMDKVSPSVNFHATDKGGYNVIDDAFHLQWSTAASPAWKNVGEDHKAGTISPLKAGAHTDVKLRLKIDAKAPAGYGLAFVSGDYVNWDESCGGNFSTEYAFDLLPSGSAVDDEVDDAKPGETTPPTPDNKPQGGTSTTPENSGDDDGSLASTGSSSALPQVAAAAGGALALGAAALFTVRRRRSNSAV
ncbi:peptidase [Streptomyces sp. NPDC051217]|uniref:peptidase n=1 Tax=Streptomyces sp. NPDC051217 TaxID=3365644 RepID=UPI003787842E